MLEHNVPEKNGFEMIQNLGIHSKEEKKMDVP